MNRMQRSLTVLALCTSAGAGGFFGTALFREAPSAQAQDKSDTSPPTQGEISKIADLATVFRKIGHQVEPSVVNINVRKTVKGAAHHPRMDDDMLRRFFPDRNGDGTPDLPPGLRDDGGDMEQIGTGSGVIIDTDGSTGYIVTNNHVGGGASELLITLADGRQIHNGKVLGTDPKTDVCVIKIEADKLVAAKWGDSDQLDRGDWVMAFGSPFGYIGSMTHGIVSALNRDRVGILGQGGYENFIQVDAPINPGNSGGPLVNVRGEVVGINTAIASRSGGFQGIGFAIPSNQAKLIYKQLKEKGKVVRGWLGVKIQDISQQPELGKSLGYTDTEGVLVAQSYADTPASGKLKHGDVITGINGHKVLNTTELRNKIAETSPGQDVTLQVFRDGKNQEVSIKLGEQPEDLSMASGRKPRGADGNDEAQAEVLGMTLSNLTEDLRGKFNLGEEKAGAVVTDLEAKSRAARGSMQVGDLITEVGSKKVATAKEARDALSAVEEGKGVRLYVTNREGSLFRFIPAVEK